MTPFATRVIDWQRSSGRHGLPWQGTREPYRIWLSEIMLQQTQVATVLPYYARFLERFPDVASLAAASLDEVLGLWSGLGYYSRARNLHACALAVMSDFGGRFPTSSTELETLPGIGPSTAAAIAAFAAGERVAILDGNVKRVLARHRGIDGWPGTPAVTGRLWKAARASIPADDSIERYTQGLMDLGATVCTRSRPRCEDCPVSHDCVALLEQRTAELPSPRPRKAVVLRQAAMLVIRHERDVWLVKRPPSGIWGGLMTLPQCDDAAAAKAAAMHIASRAPLRALPLRRHVFTHFTLDFEPWLVTLDRKPQAIGEATGAWLSLDAIDSAALPAPIRVLLRSLDQPTAAEPAQSTFF
ncbi:A/G-specific adenine glycosylase [soil metagenome]